MMGKIILVLDDGDQRINLSDQDKMKILKMFLKLARITADKANDEMQETAGNERMLFEMVKVYSEKCQTKLFNISQILINKLTNINTNTKKVPFDKLSPEEIPYKTPYSDTEADELVGKGRKNTHSTEISSLNTSCEDEY